MTDATLLALAGRLVPKGTNLALVAYEPFNEPGVVVSAIHVPNEHGGSLRPLVEAEGLSIADAERNLHARLLVLTKAN